jgi:excisionase family DNA binding protein
MNELVVPMTTERRVYLGEAARRLGVSIWTARRWAEQRRLPACRPGGPGTRWQVDVAELDALLAGAAG